MQRSERVDDLIGAQLDAAVARAKRRGLSFDVRGEPPACYVDGAPFSPSSDWSHGGPIIERERVALEFLDGAWCAWSPGPQDGRGADGEGSTPLVAAMRAYVASKFGETVERP